MLTQSAFTKAFGALKMIANGDGNGANESQMVMATVRMNRNGHWVIHPWFCNKHIGLYSLSLFPIPTPRSQFYLKQYWKSRYA
jgi:hypothetical protein